MSPDEAARRLVRDPRHTALFVDFDGTLTPIVEDPTLSRLADRERALLAELGQRLAVVAVVSGRPAAFLAERSAVDGVRLLGLYGLEDHRDGRTRARAELSAWEPAVDRAKHQLAARLAGADGVRLEDKGRSVAVHWRHARDPAAAQRLVERTVDDVARATGLALEPGKLVAELRPPVEWDKGAAVDAVSEEVGATEVAYVGDDRGDLPALRAARERGGIAVGVDHGAETPLAVREAADVLLDGPVGVTRWLEQLVAALGSGS